MGTTTTAREAIETLTATLIAELPGLLRAHGARGVDQRQVIRWAEARTSASSIARNIAASAAIRHLLAQGVIRTWEAPTSAAHLSPRRFALVF